MKKENSEILEKAKAVIENIKGNLKSGFRLGAKDNEDFNMLRRAIQKIEPFMLMNELVRNTIEKYTKELDEIQKRQIVAEKRSASSPRDKSDGGKKIKIDQTKGFSRTDKLSRQNTGSNKKNDMSFDDTESEGGGYKKNK